MGRFPQAVAKCVDELGKQWKENGVKPKCVFCGARGAEFTIGAIALVRTPPSADEKVPTKYANWPMVQFFCGRCRHAMFFSARPVSFKKPKDAA